MHHCQQHKQSYLVGTPNQGHDIEADKSLNKQPDKTTPRAVKPPSHGPVQL